MFSIEIFPTEIKAITVTLGGGKIAVGEKAETWLTQSITRAGFIRTVQTVELCSS